MIRILHDVIVNKTPIMVYGAGSNAKKQMEILKRFFVIKGIWDVALAGTNVFGYMVLRPFELAEAYTPKITIVTIKDLGARKYVVDQIKGTGCERVFFSDDVIQVLYEVQKLHDQDVKEISLIEELWNSDDVLDYEYLESNLRPVNYSVIKRRNTEDNQYSWNETDVCENIWKRLGKILILKKEEALPHIQKLLEDQSKSGIGIWGAYEYFFRELLSGSVKTKERPIRMVGDEPYDAFAVFEAQKQIIMVMCGNDLTKALNLTEELIFRSYTDKYLRAIKADMLSEMTEFDSALCVARELVKDYPTDFLVNEVFYRIAMKSKKEGIRVMEPLPDIDLKGRFCWSGMTFAWFGGFDENGCAITAPCFRAIECAARPEGDFCEGDEWRLFRESLLDGSFRYCQKNQCTNIIGGWLPEKVKCTNEVVKSIIDGNTNAEPMLEEIHLSYDKHCNLICSSCRTSRCTHKEEDVRKLDDLFDRNIAPLLKSVRHLCLSGSGEALLSLHSSRIIKELPKYGNSELKVELRTNMTALNEVSWKKLGGGRKYIRHIAASIDACSKMLFEKLRYPAQWETVLRNLEFVKDLRERGEIDLFEFHVVVQNANLDQLVDLAEMAIIYRADAITYSKVVNWQGMSREEYERMNPFYIDHPRHGDLLKETMRLKQMRDEIQSGIRKTDKPFYMNIHFEPDPDDSYETIRYGILKIR